MLYFLPWHLKGVGGQRQDPAAPYSQERQRLDYTRYTEGCVGLRAGLDRGGKSRPHRDSNPDRPARRQSLYPLRYPAHT